MIRNLWKIAVRSFLKRKFFFFIVVSGLCLGLSAFIMIRYYIWFETSYDTFHKDHERIFRVQLERTYPDRVDLSAGVTAGAGPLLKENFPTIEHFTKLWATKHLKNILEAGPTSLTSDKLYFADQHFFKVFSFSLQGDTSSLTAPNSVVISRDFATRMFGTTEVIGESLDYHSPWGTAPLKITGVVQDAPANSHIDFEVLVSFSTLVSWVEQADRSFGWNAFNTYILTRTPGGITEVRDGLKEFIDTYYVSMRERGIGVQLHFQPLADVHLGPEMRFEPKSGGDATVLNTLSIASIFILLLAWLNYINLVTAQLTDRTREIGIRKVSGASRFQLLSQFYVEALLVNVVAILLTMTLVEVGLPYFNALVDVRLPGQLYLNPQIWGLCATLVLLGTFVSGTYPALRMASFAPHMALRRVQLPGTGALLRKGLVIFQFAVSFVLIAGTMALIDQLDFMQSRSLGFNASQILILEGPGVRDSTYNQRFDHFTNNLKQMSGIHAVSNSTSVPGHEITWVNNSVRWTGSEDENFFSMPFNGVGAEFHEMMELQLLEGRFFVAKEGETENIILTASAARILGFPSPADAIGETIMDSQELFTVIGVTEDFHQQSLSKDIDPVIFRYIPYASSYFVLKVETEDLQQIISRVRSEWNSQFAGNPYDYFFLDSFFNQQYRNDVRFTRIFGLFAALGIVIGILGLFALSLFLIRQRTSEISIRKVLGASVGQVVRLVSLDYLRIVLISAVAGLPLSWWLADQLLSTYTYRIDIGPGLLLQPAIWILTITLLTTCVQTLRAATLNPVDSLREDA